MKFTNDQFTEIAFIFEKENGNIHTDFEKEILSESTLSKLKPTELEKIIINGLNTGIYKNEDERVSGYWALSKTGNKNLISNYQKWLKTELENENEIAIYQILIALDRLDEPVFNKNRSGQSVNEIGLNIKDAKAYLVKI